MSSKKNYWTQQRRDGKWESKREGASRAGKVSDTQSEAWAHSKKQAKESKGEALLKARNGQIRERNTYGRDPRKTKG